MKKNLTLDYCIRIARNLDPEFADYISCRTEKELNMEEVSGYIRDIRDRNSEVTIKYARKAARMTQQQLADESGVNIRQIQRVESGASQAGNLTAKNLIAIADALGIDPHELI